MQNLLPAQNSRGCGGRFQSSQSLNETIPAGQPVSMLGQLERSQFFSTVERHLRGLAAQSQSNLFQALNARGNPKRLPLISRVAVHEALVRCLTQKMS